jgi:exportin-2 (importin alpha re-exporter)
LTKTLTYSDKFAKRYVRGWAHTCETLIKLLEMAPMPVADENVVVEQDVDDLSFGVGFTALNTCKPQPKDLWPVISDIKTWVGQFYIGANRAKGGELMLWIRERLSPEVYEAFSSILNGAKG